MKKGLKILLITLLSLVGVVALALGTVCTIVFSPKILVPVVEKNLNKMETFSFELDNADLVFFKTFPRFSIHIEGFEVMTKPAQDTIACVDDLYASIDIMAFLKREEVIVERFSLKGGFANLALLPETAQQDTVSSGGTLESLFPLPFAAVDLDQLSVDDFDVIYGDGTISAQLDDIDTKVFVKSSKEWLVDGDLELSMGGVTLSLGDTLFCDNVPMEFSFPFLASLQKDSLALKVNGAKLKYSDVAILLGGDVLLVDEGVETDLQIEVSPVEIADILPLVPQPYLPVVQDYNLSGEISVRASAEGLLSSSYLPLVEAELLLKNGGAEMLSVLPYRVKDIDAKIVVDADLNAEKGVNATIQTLSAVFNGSNKISLKGSVSDVLGEMFCDASLSANLNLKDLLFAVPDSMNVNLAGRLALSAKAKGELDDFTAMNIGRTFVSASMVMTDVEAVYQDTVFVSTPRVSMKLGNSLKKESQLSECEDVNGRFEVAYAGEISTDALDITMGSDIYGTFSGSHFKYGVSDLLDPNIPLSAFVDYSIDGLYGTLSELEAAVVSSDGTVALLPGEEYWFDYGSQELFVKSGNDVQLDTEKILLAAQAKRDTSAVGLLAQWNPEVNVDFANGVLLWSGIEDNIDIPAIKFSYSSDTLSIEDSRIILGNSDFKLSGLVSDISSFVADESSLRADFDFVSERTDIDQLLDYFSGMGVETEEVAAEDESEDLSESVVISSTDTLVMVDEDEPFMVPGKIDLALNTKIKSAVAFGNEIQNLGGGITIKDEALVLRQLGFTSDAARMQLTAMYKSPRRNHLYAGIDFHLLDIEIDKLIQMVPQVDSIVPMLKSFSGQAEFHLAAETYLNSKYELKKSTLLGAAAIEGKDLVVLDSETFDTIASLLSFQKSQENKIDSLVVDVTVFRNEVDVYPFVIGMDKYQLILSGRHNLDMSFNYHIDCISPIRLGLDVKGTLDDLDFNITPTRYRNLFVPERRNDVQERTVKLMDLINSSLKEKVVEE
ncbi:MAG: hypothetical protein J6U51_00790 [Bacteroidales bacterium]|nr:hypothetical protein [Bacteroidales bacterium]